MTRISLLMACVMLVAACSGEPAPVPPSDDSLIQAYADRFAKVEGVQRVERRGSVIVVRRDDQDHPINVKGVVISPVPDNAMKPFKGELSLQYGGETKTGITPAFFVHYCADTGGVSKWEALTKKWGGFECEFGAL